MSEKIWAMRIELWLWGGLILLIVGHLLWCQFMSYPASFERQLRRGKPWVYIPLRWKGIRKFGTLTFSRLLVLGIAAEGAVLLLHQLGRKEPVWFLASAILFLVAALRLDTFWTERRYHQQEDAFYLLHDELRAKMEHEGKDFTDSQCRSLAIYQHQQRLRKADEAGHLIAAMRQEAKRSRRHVAVDEPVET